MNNKLIFSPSKKPVITEKDTGIWRRIINIIFGGLKMNKITRKKYIGRSLYFKYKQLQIPPLYRGKTYEHYYNFKRAQYKKIQHMKFNYYSKILKRWRIRYGKRRIYSKEK